MPNTLGLNDDLDPVEAVFSLEKAFALDISDAEAEACTTVGDIFDLLETRFAARMGEPGSCMTSMAFYRLRRALQAMRPDLDCRPDTPLAIYAGRNARRFLNQLRRRSAMHMPGPRGRWLGAGGGLLAVVSLVGLIVAATQGAMIQCGVTIALMVFGAALIRLDPGALPAGCATVGDLAIKAGALNYGSLASAGGAVRAKDLWDAMAQVLAEHSDLPASAMRRDTLILQSAA